MCFLSDDGFMTKFPKDFLSTRNKWADRNFERSKVIRACRVANYGKPTHGLPTLYKELCQGSHPELYLDLAGATPEKKDRRGLSTRTRKNKQDTAEELLQHIVNGQMTIDDVKRQLNFETNDKGKTTTSSTPTSVAVTPGDTGPAARVRTAPQTDMNAGAIADAQDNPGKGEIGNKRKSKRTKKRPAARRKGTSNSDDDYSDDAVEASEIDDNQTFYESRKKFKENWNALSHRHRKLPDSRYLVQIMESYETLGGALGLNPFNYNEYQAKLLDSDPDTELEEEHTG